MGEEFLNRLYKDMYKSEEVMHGIDSRYIGNKEANIANYLNRMDTLHERISNSSHIGVLKEFYYRKYVIKKEDIPNVHYDLQVQIALDRGYGHIELDERIKEEMAQTVIDDQKKSLDIWIDYFLSEDSKFYPFWAKYWAFQGMLTMGTYNKETNDFKKRTKHTVSIFAPLDMEALSLSIDYMIKYLNREEVSDEILSQLLKNGSFQKVYTYIINYLDSKNKENSNINSGVWVKYLKGTDHLPLVKSLQGKGTGWCTSGEETAKHQLENGDFYVYYSYDTDNNPTIPRIAIRMENGKIAEIRGISKDQNLESEMEEIVDKKLEEFPDKEEYKKKTEDMRKLTEIYKFRKNSPRKKI